jgi:hypothetical protein
MTQIERERKLRQDIQAIRILKYGWPEPVLKGVMQHYGFGSSLRSLAEPELSRLKSLLVENRKHGLPAEYTYDKQGMFMFALTKQIGWSDSDLRAYLIKHYRKSHWNLLTTSERRGVIAMLLNYQSKQATTKTEPEEDS